jgi:hypothetical protein
MAEASENPIELSTLAEYELANEEQLNQEAYPCLFNISAAFIYQFLPHPTKLAPPEFTFVPIKGRSKTFSEIQVAVTSWNWCWESNNLRYFVMKDSIPTELKWLSKFKKHNLYLLPDTNLRYDAYTPLYHMLPKKTLQMFGLPLFNKGIWPPNGLNSSKIQFLDQRFNDRLSAAFAYHIWPFLIKGSYMKSFNANDPIVILSHNLDYWLPYSYLMAEERLRQFSRCVYDNVKQEKLINKIQRQVSNNIKVNRPLKGGSLWIGEKEALEATKELIEFADKKGSLRSIIDAIKSNRIQDDFSAKWSYAREDFERKLYKKRSKFRVSFVELDDTIPVQGPSSEIEENLVWEDFISILNPKERQIVVCLKNGITKLGEISHILGYANHSPISKSLSKIRSKALQYFNEK